MSSTATSHPFIGVLTRQIDYTFWLYRNQDRYTAWDTMVGIMEQLKDEHKKRDDYTKLLREIKYAIRRINRVRYFNAPDAQLKKKRLAASVDRDFYSRFMSLMWACNMLIAGAYQEYDPTGGKSSDKVDIDIGERDITSII